jgi:probable phosphoglycerate mutase
VWTGELPNGESIERVAARADRVIERALAADGDVALFAHGHILRVLTARWCDLIPQEGRRFMLDTGTLSLLGWEHEYRGIRGWNRG